MIGVDPPDREPQVLRNVGQGREHVHLRFVAHRPILRPPGCDVSHGEGETELPARVATLLIDQVDLHEARTALVMIGQVRVRIRDFNSDPGVVCERPFRTSLGRAGTTRRSMAA
jgi:hypothetical protein